MAYSQAEITQRYRKRHPDRVAAYIALPSTRIKRNTYARKYREQNRERHKAKDLKRYTTALNFIRHAKSGGCSQCGEKTPVCIDFHHIDPTTKLFNISSRLSKSIKTLWNEIAKCTLLCANCHRKLHAIEEVVS